MRLSFSTFVLHVMFIETINVDNKRVYEEFLVNVVSAYYIYMLMRL